MSLELFFKEKLFHTFHAYLGGVCVGGIRSYQLDLFSYEEGYGDLFIFFTYGR
jgi:hypothetical protein